MSESTPAAAGRGAGRVLVVDDEPANRLLFRDMLEAQDYEVEEAADGVAALLAAKANPPDVVVLDVMMPRLDGYVVCQQLKATPATAAVPVLLVTSLHAREERLQGIRVGAADFLTKPVDRADLVLRVRNAVASKRLYDQMAAQYLRLHELEALRDSLVHMVIHDLRSPFGALAVFLQLIESDPAGALTREQVSCLADCRLLVAQITEMINAVLDVSRLEAGKMPVLKAQHALVDLVEEAVRTLGPRGAVRVRIAPAGLPVRVECDRGLISRVLLNLIGNALKFSPEEAPVEVRVTNGAGTARVDVRDHGPGISAERQEGIFEKFGQVNPHEQRRQGHYGVGLGLTFCRLAVDAHAGAIGLTSTPGQGSTFWFELPMGRSGT